MAILLLISCFFVSTQALSWEIVKSHNHRGHAELTSFAFRTAEREQQDLEDGVLAFVPGVVPDRIGNVKKTIAWLQAQEVPTECIIYTYQDIGVPSEEMSPCTVIDNEGGQWMDHFVRVPLNMTKKKYVLSINDGLELQSVNLARMIKAIRDNDLVHVSPALYGVHHLPTMVPHLGFGRRVPFIEYHVDLFTRANFACLQDLVASNDTRGTDNHWGWFVDSAMTFLCPGGLGVIDAMKMFKFSAGSYAGGEKTGVWDYGPMWDAGEAWMRNHGWPVWHALVNHSAVQLPLKGDLLPTDPQCNQDDRCICPDTNCEPNTR